MGFSDSLVVKSLPANVGDLGSVSGSGRFPGDGSGNPTPVFLLGKSHGQRSLVLYSPWELQNIQTQFSN